MRHPPVRRFSGCTTMCGAWRIPPKSIAWICGYSRARTRRGACRSWSASTRWIPAIIRPIAIRAYGDIGVNPLHNPVDVYLACWIWGKYLGEEALAEGVDVCVSSWKRIAPNTLPALAKAGANYMNSQLIKMEAITNGYTEGIALDEAGYVSEGSGENIFLVRDGRLHTPPLGASVLPGITRDSVLRLAERPGYSRWSKPLCRARCFTLPMRCSLPAPPRRLRPSARSTASRSATAIVGPITEKLQKEFFALIHGDAPDRYGWLSPVHARQPVGVDK